MLAEAGGRVMSVGVSLFFRLSNAWVLVPTVSKLMCTNDLHSPPFELVPAALATREF